MRISEVHVCSCATRVSCCSRTPCYSRSMARRIVVRVPSGEQGLHSSSCCQMMRINGWQCRSQSVNIAADSECPYSIWVRAAKAAETPIHLTQRTAMPMQVRQPIPEPSDQTVRNLWWHR